MNLTQRALAHNRSAYLAELHTAAVARRYHNDRLAEQEINRTIIALQAGEDIENYWSDIAARRLIHVS